MFITQQRTPVSKCIKYITRYYEAHTAKKMARDQQNGNMNYFEGQPDKDSRGWTVDCILTDGREEVGEKNK